MTQFTLEPTDGAPREWEAEFSTECCGTIVTRLLLQVTGSADGVGTITLKAYDDTNSVVATWKKENIPANQLYLFDEQTLTLVSSTGDCEFSQFTTLSALDIPLEDPNGDDLECCACLMAMEPGCPPGSSNDIDNQPQPPDVGAAVWCESCQDWVPPEQLPPDGCGPVVCTDCGAGIPNYFEPPPGSLGEAAGFIGKQQNKTQLPLPSLNNSPGQVNLSGGNLTLPLGLPNAGPFSYAPNLTYNSKSEESHPFGYGWSSPIDQQVTVSGTSAELTGLHGTRYRHSFKGYNGNTGRYQSHEGNNASLHEDSGSGQLINTLPNGVKVKFPATGGAVTEIQNGAGQTWDISTSRIVDPLGRRTTMIHNGLNSRVIDPAGRITTFTRDGNDNLVKQITPDGAVTEFKYSGHKLTAMIDAEGNRTSYSYDSLGWVSSVHSHCDGQTDIQYIDTQNTKITDPAGNFTQLTYNKLRNVETITEPLGNCTSYTWDANNLTGRETVKGSASLAYEKRNDGSRVLVTAGVAGVSNYSYSYTSSDPDDKKVASVTNLNGKTTNLVWDGNGNRIATVDPAGNRTSYSYNTQGQVTAVTNPLAERTTLVYDGSGNLAARVDALGHRTSYSYDTANQRVAATNPLGFTTTTVRDVMNRPLAEINPLGERTSYSYDLIGNTRTVTNPLGHVTTHSYDCHKLVSTTDPLGHITTYVSAL